MDLKKYKKIHIFSMILFGLLLLINYLSSLGTIFPYTQKEISDTYQNLLAPASFTFSIWGVIYVGVVLSLILPWIKKLSQEFKEFYYVKVIPRFIVWMVLNIFWIVTWSYDLIFIALIIIVLYTFSLVELVKTLDQRSDVSFQHPWLLVFPVGLHTGWLTFASFTNVITLLVKNGLDSFSQLGVILTIALMVLACLSVLLLFNKYDNAFITVPALWALFGIFMEQRPGSDFEHANPLVMYASLILMALALFFHFKILKKHRQIRKNQTNR